jgi:DNA-directed RNA polymerase specialized sigma24 family protein
MTPNQLATLNRNGDATEEQINDLACATMRVARIAARVACKERRIRQADIEDVVQLATLKAMERVKTWEIERSSWTTFVSVIAKSAIADQGRRYLKENRLHSTARENIEIWERIDQT